MTRAAGLPDERSPLPRDASGAATKLRALLLTVGWLAGLGALLFASAGTLAWAAGWAFVALMAGAGALIEAMLGRRDPALLAERLGPPIQPGQEGWDKAWISAFLLAFLAWLALMALDAVRFSWSHVPAWLRVVGAVAIVGCYWISYLAFRENTFLAPVVRLQTERGHRVVSSGPYAHVRHPMYAGALLYLVGTALLLGSWYGLAATVVLAAGIALRAVLEERTLARGLPGYRAYMRQVKRRLIPGIW